MPIQYIALSLDPYPDSPGPTAIFPFLRCEPGTPQLYRWAMLAPTSNPLLLHLLDTVGFVFDNAATPTAADLPTTGTWQFAYLPDSVMQPLQDGNGSHVFDLSHYLTITVPSTSDLVLRPTQLVVVVADLDSSLWRGGTVSLKGVEYDSTDTSFRFGAADPEAPDKVLVGGGPPSPARQPRAPTPDHPTATRYWERPMSDRAGPHEAARSHLTDPPISLYPGFQITLVNTDRFFTGPTAQKPPPFSLAVSHEGGWQDGVLLANGSEAIAGLAGRLDLGPELSLRVYRDEGGATDKFRIECDLVDALIDVPFGVAGPTRIDLGPDGLRLAFTPDSLRLYFRPDDVRRFAATARMPMIMALPQGGGTALPQVVRAVAQDGTLQEELFRLTLRYELPTTVTVWDDARDFVADLGAGTSDDSTFQFGSKFGTGSTLLLDRLDDFDSGLADFTSNLRGLIEDTNAEVRFAFGSANDLGLPPAAGIGHVVTLTTRITLQIGSAQPGLDTLSMLLSVPLQLQDESRIPRLASNRLFFYLEPFSGAGPADGWQYLDFDSYLLALPARRPDPTQQGAPSATETHHDGYIDLEQVGFSLDFLGPDDGSLTQTGAQLYFPGGASSGAPNPDELANRFLLRLDTVSPKLWPQTGEDSVVLRVDRTGLTFLATLSQSLVQVEPPDKNVLKPLQMRPVATRQGVISRIVVIENQVREATLLADLVLPGFDDLKAQVEAGLRQEKPRQPPSLYVAIQLEQTDAAPVAQFAIGGMQLKVTELDLRLTWDRAKRQWGFGATASGELSIPFGPDGAPVLDGFAMPQAIKIRGLDLVGLNAVDAEVPVTLTLNEPPYRFSMLDDRFSVAVQSLALSWRGGQPLRLSCVDAAVGLKAPEVFGLKVEAGQVDLVFTPGTLRLHVEVPEPLTVTVELGSGVMFLGKIGLVHDEARGVRYFLARGQVRIDGFTWVEALVKVGTLRKRSGASASQLVIFGAADLDVEIFSGVVAKSLGAGLAVNNRLKAISPRPTADELLRNIDQLQPDDDKNWVEVDDDGSYVEIVATTMLASNSGGTGTVNTYVLAVVLSLDTNLDVVAGAKLWLQSSVDFVRQNINNPVLVGAIAFVPRQRTLTAALQTRPNPAIQTNAQLQKILSNTTFRLAFRMAPGLVDYDLQEISYHDNFLGATMLFTGSYREAVFRDTVLVKAGLSVSGGYSNNLRCGPGGFAFDGSLALRGDFGGLLSSAGIDMYAAIDAGVSFRTSAFLVICWTITVKVFRKRYSKTFSKTLRLDARPLELRFRGAIAVRRDGVLGFAGSVGISVSIFGYRLAIAPSLAVNGGVIGQVREQVSAFEQRLDEYVDALSTQSAVAMLAATPRPPLRLDAADGTWLLYKTVPSGSPATCYVLLLPATDALWLTPRRGDKPSDAPPDPGLPGSPPPFYDHVTEVTLLSASTPLVTLNPPWQAANTVSAGFREKVDGLPVDQRDQLYDIVPLFFESTLSGQSPDPGTPWSNITIVRDPRVETTDRRFLRPEDRNLPPGVLSFEMDPLDDVALAGIGQPDVFEEAARYEDYANRAARIERHQGEDLDEVEAAQAVRSRIVRMLLEDLRRPGGPSQFGEYARDTSGTTPAVLGWIVALDPNVAKQVAQVQVTRVGSDGTLSTKTLVVTPGDDTFDQVTNPVTPLPIRQKFQVTAPKQSGDDKEQARVLVKVPIKLADALIQGGMVGLGHFQVFRRVGNATTWSLLADEVRPRITMIDDVRQEVRVQGTVLAVDSDPSKHRVQLDEKASENSRAYLGWQAMLLPLGESELVLLPYDVASYAVIDDGAHWLTLTVDAKHPWPPPGVDRGSVYQLIETVKGRVALVEPYLFGDEFPVVDRAFTEPVLPAGASLTVRYMLRVVPHGDTTVPDKLDDPTDGRLIPLETVSLYVPPVDPFPSDLGAVFAVRDLRYPRDPNTKQKGFPFQIVTTGGEAPGLPQVGDHPLSTSDFELWIEPVVRKQSGFYVGGEYGPAPAPQPDRSQVGLADVDATPPPEFTRGKFRADVLADPGSAGTGKFTIADHPLFRPGFGYRLYVRHLVGSGSSDSSDDAVTDALVTPLPAFLVPELPGDGFAPTSLRPVDQLEHIPADDYEAIRLRTATLAPLDAFSAGDRFDEALQVNLLTVTADTVSAVQGGIEVVVHDRDDSSAESRVLCETMEEAVFIHSETQFAETSYWALPPGLRPSDLTPPDPAASVTFLLKDTDILLNYYYYIDSAENTVLRDLAGHWATLDAALQARKTAGWRSLLVPAGNWARALRRFLRSPLNVNDPDTLRDVAAMLLALRLLVLGLKFNPADVGSWQGALDDLNKRVDAARDSTTDQVPADTPPDDVAAFRDSDLSRQLAAIALRRSAVADDLLAGLDSNIPFYSLAQAARDAAQRRDPDSVEILPRGLRWAEIEADYYATSSGGDPIHYPATDWLIHALPSNAPGDDGAAALSKLAGDFVDRVVNKPPPDRLRALGQVAPHASGLSRVLDGLPYNGRPPMRRSTRRTRPAGRVLDGLPYNGRPDTRLDIDLRPHHGFVPAVAADGSAIATASSLLDYLPDAAKLALQQGGALPMPSRDPDTLAGQVVNHLNLLERLGFAVDLQLTNALGEALDLRDMVAALRRAARLLPQLLLDPGEPPRVGGHDARVVVGLQSGSSLRAAGSTPVGYSFAKLVVMPRELTVLLTDRGLVEFGTSPGPAPDDAQHVLFLLDPSEDWQLPDPKDYVGLTLVITQGTAQGEARTVVNAQTVNKQRILTVDSPWPPSQIPDATSVYSLHDARPLVATGPDWLTLVETWMNVRAVVVPDGTAPTDRLTLWWHVRQAARFVLASGPFSDAYFAETASLPPPPAPPLPAVLPEIPVLVLEPVATGSRALAAVGGRCQLNWIVPDAHGHRYRVAVRLVSRYGPIVSWAERLTREVEVFPDAPDGAGDPPAWDSTVQRVLPSDRTAVSDPLPVVWIPHPTEVKFQYQLPSEGIRAGLNQISAIRTGYRGCLWQFDYDLIDTGGPADPPVTLETLLAAVTTGPTPAAAKLAIDRIPRNASATNRLLASERQVTLTDLPFYYHYRLEVRAAYESRKTAPPQALDRGAAAAGLVARRPPRDPAGDPGAPAPTAQRAPGFLGTWPPAIHAMTGASLPPEVAADLSFTVFLPSNRDHLSPWEADASPPSLTRSLLGKDVAAKDLPDFAVQFQILYGLTAPPPPRAVGDLDAAVAADRYGLTAPPLPPHAARRQAGATQGLVYLPLCLVVAPWNPAFQPSTGIATDRPYVQLFPSGVDFLDANGKPVVDGNGVPLPVMSVAVQASPATPGAPPAAPSYYVTFTVRVLKKAAYYNVAEQYVLQTLRDGYSGRSTSFQIV
ncbi:MAG: hypothetical protein ABSH35_00625 [Isosphaeraceae bacterium]